MATNGANLEEYLIIEIFAGSARVTAALRQLGMKSSFGVDKLRSKNAMSSVLLPDLTTPEGESLLMSWLQIPNVVGIFLAPPCGSASRARQIPLKRKFGCKGNGPRPLRTDEFPNGVPNLNPTELSRVSLANQLYTRSASPVFPQLGLEPNHAGLASQSLFLLEELLQSKTQWHSKTFSSSKNDLKEFRAHSNVFQSSQNKTSSTQTQNNLPNSSQNNMFLRHGSNNIQNTKNPQKNEKSTSKLFHAQTGSIWFQIGSYVVPTWFLRFSIVQMVVPTNLKVTYLFSCTCNVPR